MQTLAKLNIADSKLSTAARKLTNVIEHRLPVPEEGIKDVLKLIKGCSTGELSAFGLQPPPAPSLSQTSNMLPLQERLQAVQALIGALQYNYSPSYYYNVSKQRPLSAILSTAAGILHDPLPIKCIEAVFLGLLLTQGWEKGALQRIPVGFKSMGPNGQVYRHIVLAVHDPQSGCFGGLGISRRDNLMYKPLAFQCLAELIQDYIKAYSCWSHQVVKVRVGLPVEHDSAYSGPVCWRYCTINPQKRTWDSVASILNTHAAAAARLQGRFKAAFAGPSTCCTPRSPRAKPHTTRPYGNSSSNNRVTSQAHESDAAGATGGPLELRSSRQGLQRSNVHVAPPAGAYGCRAPLSLNRGCHTTTSSSDSSSNQQGWSSIFASSYGSSTNTSTTQHIRIRVPDVACTSMPALSPASCISGSMTEDDDADSSSDEAGGALSACTFDSDSEVNIVVDSIRHQQQLSPDGVGAPQEGSACQLALECTAVSCSCC